MWFANALSEGSAFDATNGTGRSNMSKHNRKTRRYSWVQMDEVAEGLRPR